MERLQNGTKGIESKDTEGDIRGEAEGRGVAAVAQIRRTGKKGLSFLGGDAIL
jgi:hypothetical protein